MTNLLTFYQVGEILGVVLQPLSKNIYSFAGKHMLVFVYN
jgi:hypothetical protein